MNLIYTYIYYYCKRENVHRFSLLQSHVKTSSSTDTPLRFRAGSGANRGNTTTTTTTEDHHNSSTKRTDSNSSMDHHGGFESLKREATKLERQLEEKVAKYQQVRTVQYSTALVVLCLLASFTV